MLDKMTNQLGFQGNALILRAERQRIIASNIANADTPGYVARDFDFASTLREATKAPAGTDVKSVLNGDQGPAVSTATADPRHFRATTTGSGSASTLGAPRQARLCRADPACAGQQLGGPGPRARELRGQRGALRSHPALHQRQRQDHAQRHPGPVSANTTQRGTPCPCSPSSMCLAAPSARSRSA